VSARRKRRIAGAMLTGIFVLVVAALIFGIGYVFAERGFWVGLALVGGFTAAVGLPIWISAWAHAEDER
jgi:hypothetical protein